MDEFRNVDDRNVEVEKRSVDVQRREDSGLVASTFIKYAAYLVIFFGILYFIIQYLLPMIRR